MVLIRKIERRLTMGHCLLGSPDEQAIGEGATPTNDPVVSGTTFVSPTVNKVRSFQIYKYESNLRKTCITAAYTIVVYNILSKHDISTLTGVANEIHK